MSGFALNTLGYTGTVQLSQYNRKTEQKRLLAQIHNAGTSNLFNFFTDCLIGAFDSAKRKQPTKIKLLNKDGDTVESASGFIYLLTPPEKVSNNAELGITSGETVRFSFIVPSTLVSNSNFNTIGLYSNDVLEHEFTNYSAYCTIQSDAIGVSWDTSSVLAVDWLLNISNAPTN